MAVDYGLHMTIPTWHAADPARLDEVPAMVAAGCATFKAYQAYPGMMLDDVALLHSMQAGLQRAAVWCSTVKPARCWTSSAQAVAAGETAAIWHERTRSARAGGVRHHPLLLAEIAGCPLLIFHVGNAAAVAAIAAAQARGIDITGETCPQYLVLTAEEHLGGPDGNLFICAPPLRSQADQDATWRAPGRRRARRGQHRSLSVDPRGKSAALLADVPGGVPSMEARLALVHHFGVGRGLLSPARWVEVCCTNPAQRMGLTHKGVLAPGYDADIVIFDPATRRALGTDTLHEAADWTPYAGVTVTGWPRTVLLCGDLVVDDHTFVGHAGAGRFVTRRHARTGT
ncbi:MAG: amidohydrolase family protein [Caldilineaceae bacterium]